MKIYLASGWFNPKQLEQVENLEKLLSSYGFIELISPRKVFTCPPDADNKTQIDTFSGNIQHIRTSDCVVVNTQDKDLGSIFEAGCAFAYSKPIVYFCEGLPPQAKFNLMLAKSGIKVTTSIKELKDYFDRVAENSNHLIYEPYENDIE